MDRFVSIVGEVARYAERQPMKAAIIEAGRTITYSQLYQDILHAAAAMRDRGIANGDRVLLSGTNTSDFATCYLAAHLLGAVSIVADPAVPVDRLDDIIALSNPKLTVGFAKYDSATQYAVITSEQATKDNCHQSSQPDEATFPCESDIADIMFTTGTTDKSKGVILTHGNIVASAQAANAFIGNVTDDIEAIALPLCHSFGLGRLRATLLNGATAILLRGFANIKAIFDAFELQHATGFAMVPAAWEYIHRLSGTKIGEYSHQLRYVELGSSSISPSQKHRLVQLLPNTRLCMHYGLTEASRSMYMLLDSDQAQNINAIGMPSQGVEAIIIGDDGTPVPTGATGEIAISGPNVMFGYLSDNDSAFAGPWFKTGDLGIQMPDGSFRLVGRKKDIINVGGKKVNPVEVEQAVISLGYADCLCRAKADAVLGEVPAISIVLSPGDAPPALSQLNARLSDRLSAHQLPQHLEIVSKIPRTSSGKPIRHAIN